MCGQYIYGNNVDLTLYDICLGKFCYGHGLQAELKRFREAYTYQFLSSDDAKLRAQCVDDKVRARFEQEQRHRANGKLLRDPASLGMTERKLINELLQGSSSSRMEALARLEEGDEIDEIDYKEILSPNCRPWRSRI